MASSHLLVWGNDVPFTAVVSGKRDDVDEAHSTHIDSLGEGQAKAVSGALWMKDESQTWEDLLQVMSKKLRWPTGANAPQTAKHFKNTCTFAPVGHRKKNDTAAQDVNLYPVSCIFISGRKPGQWFYPQEQLLTNVMLCGFMSVCRVPTSLRMSRANSSRTKQETQVWEFRITVHPRDFVTDEA